MEILFKDDIRFFHITDNRLSIKHIINYPNINLTNIPHLSDTKPLFHYRDSNNGESYPVYYDHIKRFISNLDGDYCWVYKRTKYIKDYTLVNLNLI